MHQNSIENTVEDCVMFLANEGPYLFGNTVSIDQYDQTILSSIGRQLGNGNPFTQKQSKIGLRLVKKYSSLLIDNGFDANTVLNQEIFKWPFRVIDRTKSLYIDGEQIVIKSPFIADIVNKVKKRKSPSYYRGMYHSESKTWSFDYNEPNVEFLVNLVKGMNFSIDQKIQDDYKAIIEVKKNALQYYPMLVKNNDKYVFNNTVIEHSDPRRAVMTARLQGCTVFDDSVVDSMKPKQPMDKVLLGDSQKWYINSNVYSFLDIFSLLNTVDKCIIMCSSNNTQQLQTVINALFDNGYSGDDICVMFRFSKSKDFFEGNKFIKKMQVNSFNPNKVTSYIRVISLPDL